MGRILSRYEDFREELELSVSKKRDCMKGAIRMRKFCYANGGAGAGASDGCLQRGGSTSCSPDASILSLRYNDCDNHILLT